MYPFRFAHLPLLFAAFAAGPAIAQETVVQMENVRLDYAQVLNVEPVHQTLRATRTEQQCDELPQPRPEEPEKEDGAWSRMVSSFKGLFSRGDNEQTVTTTLEPIRVNCRVVPVEREFRRPIAYDVDYVYKGVKYRSRLAEDPGNRLRIRVSVTPYVAGQTATSP
jgi:uncharacterized protein YcfJ